MRTALEGMIRPVRCVSMLFAHCRHESYIKTVVDALARDPRGRIQRPLVIFKAVECTVIIVPRACLGIRRHALAVGLDVRGEGDAGREMACHFATLPLDVPAGDVAGGIGFLPVLRVCAVGVVVHFGIEFAGFEFVAVAEIHGFARSFGKGVAKDKGWEDGDAREEDGDGWEQHGG